MDGFNRCLTHKSRTLIAYPMSVLNSPLFRQRAYIDGEWVEADSGETVRVTNPATGEVMGTVPNMGASETETALAAAESARHAWAARTAKDRAAVLKKWFALIMQHQDALGELLTLEMGKPLAEARGEVAYGASFIEWFAEEAKRLYGETIPGHTPGTRIIVQRQPIGTVAAITPWNFPNAMITRKAGPALAAGCSFVVKPANQTPYSALALAFLAEEAGIPAGLFSVITGKSREIGAIMTVSDLVRKVSFTGSTEIGKLLYQQSASTIKKLGLELGGNAPFIVFDDADIDAAVEGAIICKYRNNGQTCVCANRIYVQANVYQVFAQKLAGRVATMPVGNGLDEGVVFGPLIDTAAKDKVQEHVSDALAKGASLLLGGKPHALGGTFYEPTILTNVDQGMKVTNEETFGPVAPLFRFEDEDDVIAQANDTQFGLASYFYAKDMSRIFKVAEALEYGMVGVNTGLISTEAAPFGGVKESGLGREGSRHGLEEFTELKYICLNLD